MFDALYLLYMAGVVALLAWYALTYLRLRLALRRGTPADDAPLRRVAERYDLPVCRAVEVEGLSSAFVCGFFVLLVVAMCVFAARICMQAWRQARPTAHEIPPRVGGHEVMA